MKKIHLLAVAPYKGLGELINAVASETDDIEVDTVIGNLDAGLAQVKAYRHRKYDAVLSRGGTADMIEQMVEIPVVNVDVSGYDFVRVIRMAQSYSGKAALIGFPNVTSGAAVVRDLLQANMEIYIITHEDEVEGQIARARLEGCDMIIGDNVAVQVAHRMGINGILITSGRESVLKAFEDVRRICRYLWHYRRQNALLSAVLTHKNEYFLALSKDFTVLYHTLPVSLQKHTLSLLQRVGDGCWEPGFRSVLNVGETSYRVTGSQVQQADMEETIYTFCLERIASEDEKPLAGIRFETGNGEPADQFSRLVASDAAFAAVLQQARQLSHFSTPLLLLGAAGTGKETLVHAMHMAGPAHAGMLVTVDCIQAGPEELERIFAVGSGILDGYKGGSLYLKGLERMTADLQRAVFALLNREDFLARWRVFSSSVCSREILRASGFDLELLNLLSRASLRLPGLQERAASMADLVALCISEENAKSSVQVVAVNEDALELLRRYNWQYHIDQLHDVIHRLVVSSTIPFITAERVQALLKQGDGTFSQAIQFDRSKTLDALEIEIIQKVLEEEDYNQTKAAQRLGIGRSTMWRKLKQNRENE